MRSPAVAGQFYPGTEQGLRTEIAKYFEQANKEAGIGKNEKSRIIAAIMPHAGYFFSGKCAATGYSLIKSQAAKTKTYIVIGINHHSNETSISKEDWKTPLGIAETNKELVERITKTTGIPINENAHRAEHSIEVQIPFIQYITENKAKIVPIMIGQESVADIKRMGRKIGELLSAGKERVMIIASSDFTHYGAGYGYAPFANNSDARKKIEELDKGAVEYIKKLETEKFLKYVHTTGATICGKNAIALLLEILRQYKPDTRGELVCYYTSSDVMPNRDGDRDRDMSVSYGCVVFK